jgi:DNA replication protein DnaC
MAKIKPTIALTPDQEKALAQLKTFTDSNQKFFRLTGYAGTGKTFLIVYYIKWLMERDISFVVAAPTNRHLQKPQFLNGMTRVLA